MKYAYTAVFWKKPEDQKVYARVPDLPGCITTGKNLDDAADMIADAALLWLSLAEKMGTDIANPTPKDKIAVPDGGTTRLVRVETFEQT